MLKYDYFMEHFFLLVVQKSRSILFARACTCVVIDLSLLVYSGDLLCMYREMKCISSLFSIASSCVSPNDGVLVCILETACVRVVNMRNCQGIAYRR
jgi:hypothetical protein